MSERPGTDALKRILERLSPFNLTGKVVEDDKGIRAGGGYCEVYSGKLLPHQKSVAIRRIRVYLQDDLQFATVGHLRLDSSSVLISLRG